MDRHEHLVGVRNQEEWYQEKVYQNQSLGFVLQDYKCIKLEWISYIYFNT